MTTAVKVGLWKYAPFSGAISSSIDVLNRFIKEKAWDAYYEIVSIDPWKNVYPEIDLVMLDGGEDVNPELYGERNQFSFFNRRRDDEEMALLRVYQNGMKDRFRASGSCRGHQLLNVFFGGSLYQDIGKQVLDKRGVRHPSPHKVSTQKTNPYFGASPIINRFITSGEPFYVSSLHHQAVKTLSKNFTASLIWNFNRGVVKLIEGIESKDGRFRGVQSHPEFKSFATDGFLFSYLMHVDYFLAGFKETTEPTLTSAELENVRIKRDMRIVGEEGPASIEHFEETSRRADGELRRILNRERSLRQTVTYNDWENEEER